MTNDITTKTPIDFQIYSQLTFITTILMSKPNLHCFTPLQRLGEGTFSSVYKVRRISDGCIYALKKIKMASLKDKQKQNALNEIRILASLSSPYIVTYKEAFFDQNLKLLCIIMELANQGDLYQQITAHKSKNGMFQEVEIWRLIYHVTKGLHLLHCNQVLHRDLKSANIFINDSVYKIGDLNVSKVISDQKLVKTQTGTPYYASPEVWRDQPYGQSSDIWSLGCIFYEACAFKPPFSGDSLDDLFRSVQRGKYPQISTKYSPQLHQIIQQCLSLKPQNRPSTTQLLQPNSILMTRCSFYDIDITEASHQPSQPMLSTIKMPQDIKKLNNKLPHSQYEKEGERSQSQPSRPNSRQSNRSNNNNYRVNISKRQPNIASKHSVSREQKEKEEKANKKYGEMSPILIRNNKEPLPQRIKQHLENIQYKESHQKLLNRRPKYRIHTSIGSRQRPMLRPIERVPIFSSAIGSKKVRPVSCHIRNRPMTPLKSNGRPLTGIQPGKMRRQVKSIEGHNESSVMDNHYRYNRPESSYKVQPHPKVPQNNRCRSAQYRMPVNSSYIQLKKRFQSRQKQLNSCFVPKNEAMKPQKISQSDHSILDRPLPYISKQVYLRNHPNGLKKPEKPVQDRQYLQQIQNKLINANNHKTKKCIIAQPSQNLDGHRARGTFNKYKQPI